MLSIIQLLLLIIINNTLKNKCMRHYRPDFNENNIKQQYRKNASKSIIIKKMMYIIYFN